MYPQFFIWDSAHWDLLQEASPRDNCFNDDKYTYWAQWFVIMNFIILGSVYVKQPSEVLGRISKTGMLIITDVLTDD